MAEFTITAGATEKRVIRWQALPFVYAAIQSITQAAPARVTAASHGIVDGWPVAVVSVKGMDDINADLGTDGQPKLSEYTKATNIDVNTVELNAVNSSGFKAYKSGGYLQYYTPVDMTGFTARMVIKDKVGGTIAATLVSPTDIVIDNTAKTITVTLSATLTITLTKTSYVFEFDMIDVSGHVTPLLAGDIAVVTNT